MKRIYYVIVAVLFSLFNSNAIYAQFYDDDDEIYFYQTANGSNSACIFNFDGKKATSFDVITTLGVKSCLKKDMDYFEKKVYNADYDMKYRDDLSSSSWTVYSQYRPGSYGLSSWKDYYYFSKDRKKMIKKDDWGEYNFILVDKDYFIDGGRRRSNTNKGVIYE